MQQGNKIMGMRKEDQRCASFYALAIGIIDWFL